MVSVVPWFRRNPRFSSGMVFVHVAPPSVERATTILLLTVSANTVYAEYNVPSLSTASDGLSMNGAGDVAAAYAAPESISRMKS
jgi:hypothetical protein